MPITVTPELFGSYTPELVQVTVAGLAATDVVTVWREAAGLPRAAVRAGIGRLPVGGVVQLVDTEAPMGRPALYVAEVTTDAGVTTETSGGPVVPTDAGRHVLSDPYTGRPVRVDILLTPDERRQELDATTLRPRDRRRPIVVTDVHQDDTGTLEVYTRDTLERDDLLQLLADGTPVVSRHPADGCDHPAVEVIAVGDVRRQRRSRAGDRVFTLPFTVVETPDPALALALVQLADLAAFYVNRTLTDIAGDYATLLDLSRDDFGALA